MSEAEQAQALWRQVKDAIRGDDDRKLWLVWKLAYRHRFWRHFGVMGPGQVCAKDGVSYEDVLRRLTNYEMRKDRVSAADEAELVELGAPPSARA